MSELLRGPWRAEWEYEDDRDSYAVFHATGRVLIMSAQQVIAEIQIDHAAHAHADAIVQLILAAPDLLAACEAESGTSARLRAAAAKARGREEAK